ncbi:MAG TPA: hypothetical protein VFH74_13930 [Gaiellales bacterium]|nr:hypothetical protein [Gaiellales bacterium]
MRTRGGYVHLMQDGRGSGSICWTRASCLAALVSGSVACVLLGMLAGVMAAGGHASDVIPAITDPVAPAPAQADTTSSHHRRHVLARTVTVTVPGGTSTRTVTVRTPPVTVSRTVTVTSTETVTEPPPASSGTTGATP